MTKVTKKEDEKKVKSHYKEGDYGRLCDFIMGKKKKPVYMYQCIVCREVVYTEDTVLKHCGRLRQWVRGIEGKGVDMKSPTVKIKVSGYIEMSQENLDTLLAYDDPHMGLVYSFHMGYVNTSNLAFEPIEESE